MKNPKNFLVFCGCPGIGKTYFSAAIVEWVISTFPTYRYHTENKLFNKVRDSFDMKGDYHTTLKFLLDDDFIWLDDIGSDGHTQFREEIVFATIDNRYSCMKPTIITSNLSKNDFYKTYNPRIASRIFASENCVIELPDSPDLRRKGM